MKGMAFELGLKNWTETVTNFKRQRKKEERSSQR